MWEEAKAPQALVEFCLLSCRTSSKLTHLSKANFITWKKGQYHPYKIIIKYTQDALVYFLLL